MKGRVCDFARLVGLSARLVAGRRYWVAPLLPLLWPAFQAFRLLVGWRTESFEAASAQNTLIGVPLAVLAIGLGVRVIAGEIDRRTIEIAYTVPGGSHRVWVAKLVAAFLMLVASEILLAVVTFAFFTSFPVAALYGSMQAAVFYMVVGMAFAVLFRSEITGAMATVALLTVNALFGGRLRVSPFWNPLGQQQASDADLFAWTLQNRIGFALAIVAVVALAFARAERREKVLGG